MKYTAKWCGKILHIFDFIYRQNYYFIKAPTAKQYSAILKKQLNLDTDVKCGTDGGLKVFIQNGTEVVFIWVKNYNPAIIAHECFHATRYVLEQRGIKLTEDTDETFAYLLSFLVRTITENKK